MFNSPNKREVDTPTGFQTVAEPTNGKQEGQEKKEEELIGGITIHTMPEQFRHAASRVSQAKMTGIIIMFGGFLFLVIVSVAAYYFLIFLSGNKPQETKRPDKAKEKIINEEQKKPANELEKIFQNENKELEIATTTDEIATSGSILLEAGDFEVSTTSASGADLTLENFVSTSTSINYAPAEDSDNDSLSNAEELLFGTDNDNQDSDGDGYSDFSEIVNFYNPAGIGKLTGNPGVRKYTNKTYGYNLLCPTRWESQKISDESSIIFKSEDNQFIQVIVQPNTDNLSIDDWYLAQFSISEINHTRKQTINNNGQPIEVIKNEDGLVAYFTDPKNKHIYTINYSSGTSNVLNYLNVFQLIVASFNLSFK